MVQRRRSQVTMTLNGRMIPDVEKSWDPGEGVDARDPAIREIIECAHLLKGLGFDMSDPAIQTRAIEQGRQRHKGYRRVNVQQQATMSQRHGIEQRTADPVGTVYYMRVGNRVKIGWSSNLPARLLTFNPEELVAVETGSKTVERQRHREFSQLRTTGEWFRLEEPLQSYLVSLGKPVPPAQLTD